MWLLDPWQTPGAGRGLFALQPFAVGQVLHKASPAAVHPPLGKQGDEVCYHCLRTLPPEEGHLQSAFGRRFCCAGCLTAAQVRIHKIQKERLRCKY